MNLFGTFNQICNRSSYIKHVLTYMTGTVISQILLFCCAPLLTRLYTPEHYGIFGLFLAVLAPFQVLSSWRYEMAVVLPESDEEAKCLVGLSFVLLCIMTIVTLLIILILGRPIAHILSAPVLEKWLVLLPLSLFFVGLFNIFNYWSTRKNKFRNISIAKILQTFSTLSGQLGAGIVFQSTIIGLLASSIFGQAIGALSLIIQKLDKKDLSINWRKVLAVAKRYREIPLNTFQTAFLNACSKSLLPIIIISYFGSHIVGLILFAERVLLAPMNLITRSIWEISHSRLGKMTFEEKAELLTQVHKVLALSFAYPFVFVILFSGYCSTLFGHQWQNLNLIFPAFSLMIYFNSISNATSYFVAFEKYKIESWINIALFLVKISALIIGAGFFSAITTVNLYAAICALVYFAINVYWGIIIHNLKAFLLNIFMGLFSSLIIGLVVKIFIDIHWVISIIMFIAFTFLYYWIILQSNARQFLYATKN